MATDEPTVRITELRLPLDHDAPALQAAIRARLGLNVGDRLQWTISRRGYDARRRGSVMLVYNIDARVDDIDAVLHRLAGDPRITRAPDTDYRLVARAPAGLTRRPVVIGTGPCGILAALTLAQMGFRPIILEQGRPVRQRTQDTWAMWRHGTLDTDSNVQFGEGGAGTFSDGKLYSGIRDPRHLGRKVLREFVAAGAPEEILTISKPHIGTFRLVTIVESIRAKIEALGGEYCFGSKVVDLELETAPDGARRLRGLVTARGELVASSHVVLAIGHSARASFAMLRACGVHMEPKPFAIGVRIEHPQSLIDRGRLGIHAGNPLLGAADYKLVSHRKARRDVYSFCMCPGGRVVAATSEEGCVATNGMSQYSRAEFNANAGIVVGVSPADYPGDALAGIAFQREWERQAFVAGGASYAAPCQLVGDFLANRASRRLGEVVPSYQPGVQPADLRACLPAFVTDAIRAALPDFDRELPGFAMADAVMTGVETRTSSPVRIVRNRQMQSVNTIGLFPAGEGAGYAGGILSAGVDGIRVAEAVASSIVGDDVRVGQAG